MASLLDRFLLAFKRELLKLAPYDLNHYVRLYWDDRDRFHAALAAAWASPTPEPYISLAQVLELNGELGAKTAGRLARRLSAAGRHQEALQILQDPRYGQAPDPRLQLDLCRALLGLGRWREAATAAAHAAKMDPDLEGEAGQIEAECSALRAAESAARAGGWTETRALIDLQLAAGAVDAAALSLRLFLGGDGAVEGAALADLHNALDTILSLGPRADAYNLLRALERLYPEGPERRDLERICEGLYDPRSGRVPEGAEDWESGGRDLRASGAVAWSRAGKLEPAIVALGQLTRDVPRDPDLKAALARAVGEDVLSSHPFRLQPPRGSRKIFDVFPFNNELRMLKIKLHEMAPWVDHFVIVEARQTFTGEAKPLVFQEHRGEFAAFEDKIIHVPLDAFPPHVRHPWSREFHQRDMGLLGLIGRCTDEDLVIISDADEVIFGDVVKGFTGGCARLAVERARYFLNYREALGPEDQNDAASLWRAAYLQTFGLSYARTVLRFDKKARRLTDAGWHFTSIADLQGILAKLKITAHQEYADFPEARLARRLELVRSGRYEEGWERCPLDGRFPAYIREHAAEFEDVLI